MSFTPFDFEREEERDSERFYNGPSADDGPDPSEYMDYLTPNEWDESEVAVDDLTSVFQEMKDEYVAVFITQRRTNDALWGLLFWLVAVLLSLMFWITFGGWILRGLT